MRATSLKRFCRCGLLAAVRKVKADNRDRLTNLERLDPTPKRTAHSGIVSRMNAVQREGTSVFGLGHWLE
jgi:hypothetical protein